MKFIRYGNLARQKARRWSIDKSPMPAPRGIYAFPYGYLDYFYIWQGLGSDANPRVQYLKDETGRRLFYDELLDTPFQNGSSFSLETFSCAWNEIDARIEEEEPWLPGSAKWRKRQWGMLKSHFASYLKKKYHIKDRDEILREPRKSWIMVMDDPDKPPRLTRDPNHLSAEEVEAIPLDQKLYFLKGEDGKRIPASDLIRGAWRPERYWGDFRPLDWDDVDVKNFLEEQTEQSVDSPFKRAYERISDLYSQYKFQEGEALECKVLADWLAGKGLRLEQLCPWPVYSESRSEWAVVYKKPHIFDYSGCIWHHLQELVKHGEILRIVDDWCYTSISAYEDALRRAEPMLYERHLGVSKKDNWHGGLENPGYRNLHVPNNYVLFEVFIDSKLVEKKQN